MENRKILNIKEIGNNKYLIENKFSKILIDKSDLSISNNYQLFESYDEVRIETKSSMNIFQVNKSNSALSEYLNHLGFE